MPTRAGPQCLIRQVGQDALLMLGSIAPLPSFSKNLFMNPDFLGLCSEAFLFETETAGLLLSFGLSLLPDSIKYLSFQQNITFTHADIIGKR
jgi:hypothetical protein